jgi:hypothetical protein
MELSSNPSENDYLIFFTHDELILDESRTERGGPEVVDYARGIVRIDRGDRTAVLRHCFEYLGSTNSLIASDVVAEFGESPDDAIRAVASTAPRSWLRHWLADVKLTQGQRRVIGLLLGHCGTKDDAPFLRRACEREFADKDTTPGPELLMGYVLLAPEEAWKYVCELANRPMPFATQHAVFRTAKYFATMRPGLIPERELDKVFSAQVAHADFADLVTEYWRSRKRWDMTERVLLLTREKVFEAPVCRRAVLRFALQSPHAAAAAHAADERRRDADFVAENEEFLRIEADE